MFAKALKRFWERVVLVAKRQPPHRVYTLASAVFATTAVVLAAAGHVFDSILCLLAAVLAASALDACVIGSKDSKAEQPE